MAFSSLDWKLKFQATCKLAFSKLYFAFTKVTEHKDTFIKNNLHNIAWESGDYQTSTNCNAIAAIVQGDRHTSIHHLKTFIHMPKSSIHHILKEDLGLWCACSTWVLHMLTHEQLEEGVQMCRENLLAIEKDPMYLTWAITCNESWVHYFELKTWQKSNTWKSLSSLKNKEVRQQTSAGKRLLMAFFDFEGLVYQHYIPQRPLLRSPVTWKCCRKKRGHVTKKHPNLKHAWVLHRDNTRPVVVVEVMNFLKKHNIDVMLHPTHSPDLVPCDFWLFPFLKKEFCGHRFGLMRRCWTLFGSSLIQFHRPTSRRLSFSTGKTS